MDSDSNPVPNPVPNPYPNPDLKPDPKQIRKKSLIFRPKTGNFRQLWNISTFSWNNLIRISIYATQFTSNWLTDNRIIGIHCPVTFFAGVNFVTHCGLGKSADKMKNVAEFPNDSLILTKMPYTVKKAF